MKLSVVIVNWNALDLLKECLTSLGQQLFAPWRFEIIVVDNASTDESTKMLREEFPDVLLIENERNSGFSIANNMGIKEARGEYILLLNPDTVLRERCLLHDWISFMESRPDAGVSGCKLVFPDGRYQYGDAGYKPTFFSLVGYAFFLSKAFPGIFKGIYHNLGMSRSRDAVPVDWVCGAALMVRASVVHTVGGLDEGVFMFAEDMEWCCRIRSAGHEIYYIPFLSVEHLQGGSLKRQEDQKAFSVLWLKNLRSLYKHYNPRQPFLVFDSIMSTGFMIRMMGYYFKYLICSDDFLLEKSGKMRFFMKYHLSNLGLDPKRPVARTLR